MKKSYVVVLIILVVLIVLAGFVYFNPTTQIKESKSSNEIFTTLAKCNSANDSNALGSLCLPKGTRGWRCEAYGAANAPIRYCETITSLVRNGNISSDICYDIKYPSVVAYCLSPEECLNYSRNDANLRRICYYTDCKIKSNYNDACSNEYYYGLSVEDCALNTEDYYGAYEYLTCLSYHRADVKAKSYLCEKVSENNLNLWCYGIIGAFAGDFNYCRVGGSLNKDCLWSFFYNLKLNTPWLNESFKNIALNAFCEGYFPGQAENITSCKKLNSELDFHKLIIGCVDTDNGKDYYIRGNFTDKSGTLFTSDSCWTSTMVSEKYCNNDGSLGEEIYTCPNGCEDGACIK